MGDRYLNGARSLPRPNSTVNFNTPLLAPQGSRVSDGTNYLTMSGVAERIAASGGERSLSASVESMSSISRSSISSRRPFHYPIDKHYIGRPVYEEQEINASATYSRYRYYQRLTGTNPAEVEAFRIPDHIIPYHFFIPHLPFTKTDSDGKQSSLLTIFALWNMLMGSSLLCLPWSLQRAGLVSGSILMGIMIFVCFYTADLMIKIPLLARIKCDEFSDACYQLLGRWAQVVTVASSFITLIGTLLVYWILMSNFLFHTVSYIYEYSRHNSTISISTQGMDDIVCISPAALVNASDISITSISHLNIDENDSILPEEMFYKLWDVGSTVPVALAFLLVPIIMIKSPAIFMKFNAIGTLSVIYLLSFAIYKSWKWGVINMDIVNVESVNFIPLFSKDFPIQTGILSQALFIHNCVLTVLRLQRNPENNSRDLGIAYILVGFTYFAIATLIYLAFPMFKDCIQDNFLDNFQSDDILAFLARIFLFFQILCLFPLFVYMLRTQIRLLIFPQSLEFKPCHFLAFNTVLVVCCMVFAMYFPKIGAVIRFSGSFAGLVLIFTLPPITYIKAWQLTMESNDLQGRSYPFWKFPFFKLALHILIIILGILNFVGQFLVE